MNTRSQRKLKDPLPPSPQSKDADAEECRAPKRRKRGTPQDPASAVGNPNSTNVKRGSAGNPASAGENLPSSTKGKAGAARNPISSSGIKPNNRKRKRGVTESPNSVQEHTEAKKRKREAAGNPISAGESPDSEKRNEGAAGNPITAGEIPDSEKRNEEAAGNPNYSPCRSRSNAQDNDGKPEIPAIDGKTLKDEASISQRRITNARLRWKDLVSRILEKDTTLSPGERKLPPKKKEAAQVQRTKSTYKNQQKQIRILKHLTTWLTEANFCNTTDEESDPFCGQIFTMTESERQAFVQNMVNICENDKKMRTSLLETVKVIVESGLMVSSASRLLQDGPCEEAQNVLNAWAEHKKQASATRFPLNLLASVNQLHENKDLANKLKGHNVLSEINESTWKLYIHSESKPKLKKTDQRKGASLIAG